MSRKFRIFAWVFLFLSLTAASPALADGYSGVIVQSDEEDSCRVKAGRASFLLKSDTVSGTASYAGSCMGKAVSGKFTVSGGTMGQSGLSLVFDGTGSWDGKETPMQMVLVEAREDSNGLFMADVILSMDGAVFQAGKFKQKK